MPLPVKEDDSDASDDGDRSDDDGTEKPGDDGGVVVPQRKPNETADEKKARKQAVKEARRVRGNGFHCFRQ